MQGGEVLKQSEPCIPSDVVASAINNTEDETVGGSEVDHKSKGIETDDIVKELKEVRRQNFVTHCLLSAMIVLTLAFQLSEVSMILKVKDGLTHPFRSLGSMIRGMVKVPDMNNGQEEANSKERQPDPSSSLPSLNIPSMSNMAAQNVSFNNGDH